jgi:hypothetical protein
MPSYIDIATAAQIADVHPATIRRYIAEGRLPGGMSLSCTPLRNASLRFILRPPRRDRLACCLFPRYKVLTCCFEIPAHLGRSAGISLFLDGISGADRLHERLDVGYGNAN